MYHSELIETYHKFSVFRDGMGGLNISSMLEYGVRSGLDEDDLSYLAYSMEREISKKRNKETKKNS